LRPAIRFDHSDGNRMSQALTFCCAALSLLVASAASGQAAAPAGDAARGRTKTAMCSGCHEIPGWQTVFPETYKVPRIVGQHPSYIVKALQAYKAGDRTHPSMRAIAASLSDQDMVDLAAYYGQSDVKTAAK
jgi:cytochrome c553